MTIRIANKAIKKVRSTFLFPSPSNSSSTLFRIDSAPFHPIAVMQFKPAIVAAFVAVGLAAAAPPPTSNGKSPTSDVISFALSAGKGAAISLSNGDTVVYYQAIDGSIRELTGNGPPSTPQTYTEIVRLESSQVRRNTAIATVRDNGLGGLVRARPFSLLLPSFKLVVNDFRCFRPWANGSVCSQHSTVFTTLARIISLRRCVSVRVDPLVAASIRRISLPRSTATTSTPLRHRTAFKCAWAMNAATDAYARSNKLVAVSGLFVNSKLV